MCDEDEGVDEMAEAVLMGYPRLSNLGARLLLELLRADEDEDCVGGGLSVLMPKVVPKVLLGASEEEPKPKGAG